MSEPRCLIRGGRLSAQPNAFQAGTQAEAKRHRARRWVDENPDAGDPGRGSHRAELHIGAPAQQGTVEEATDPRSPVVGHEKPSTALEDRRASSHLKHPRKADLEWSSLVVSRVDDPTRSILPDVSERDRGKLGDLQGQVARAPRCGLGELKSAFQGRSAGRGREGAARSNLRHIRPGLRRFHPTRFAGRPRVRGAGSASPPTPARPRMDRPRSFGAGPRPRLSKRR